MKTTTGLGLVCAGLFCLVQCVSAQTNKDSGLVVHYDFSEGLGNKLHDISGHGYHGTIGPFVDGWVKAGSGYALEFEGTAKNANLAGVVGPNNPGVEMKLSDWTMTVLVKIPQAVSGATSNSAYGPESAGGYWVNKCGISDNFPGYAFGYWGSPKRTINAGMSTTRRRPDGGYFYKGVSSDRDLADGQWHHVAVVYNRQKDLQIYVDGEPSGKPADISALKNDPVEDITLHDPLRVYTGFGNAFACSMADVAIYRKALSPQEIKQMSAELLKKVAGTGTTP